MSDPNFFTILGLEERFQISDSDLKSHYYSLSKKFHPDRFVMNDEKERKDADLKMDSINRAYLTLTSPKDRRNHLLSLHLKNGTAKAAPPKDLVNEWFEIQELKGENDSKALESAKSFLIKIQKKIDLLCTLLIADEKNYDQARDQALLESIRRIDFEMQYLSSLLTDVRKFINAT